MNEIEAWYEILHSWEKVRRMKRLNQDLYDEITSALGQIIRYCKTDDIPIPYLSKLEAIFERIHFMMDEIEPPISDDRIQPTKNKPSDEEEYRTQKTKINLTRGNKFHYGSSSLSGSKQVGLQLLLCWHTKGLE
ncbi:MAG: hypothetical protein WAM14_04175, partial [Candidatus Nitrosopolaris sp.]